MAEFCIDCWNKLNEREESEEKYILSKDLDFCEGCGEWKHVIIMERREYYMYKFRYFIFPIKILLLFLLKEKNLKFNSFFLKIIK